MLYRDRKTFLCVNFIQVKRKNRVQRWDWVRRTGHGGRLLCSVQILWGWAKLGKCDSQLTLGSRNSRVQTAFPGAWRRKTKNSHRHTGQRSEVKSGSLRTQGPRPRPLLLVAFWSLLVVSPCPSPGIVQTPVSVAQLPGWCPAAGPAEGGDSLARRRGWLPGAAHLSGDLAAGRAFLGAPSATVQSGPAPPHDVR